MPARLPAEIKAQRGTLRPYREKEYNKNAADIKNTVITCTKKSIPCPKNITDPYCIKYFKKLTKGLLGLGLLSEADIPQVEQLVLTLQKLREKQEQWLQTDVTSDEWDDIDRSYERLVNRFDRLAAKYYVSPTARQKIRMDELTIREKENNITKQEESFLSKLLKEQE